MYVVTTIKYNNQLQFFFYTAGWSGNIYIYISPDPPIPAVAKSSMNNDIASGSHKKVPELDRFLEVSGKTMTRSNNNEMESIALR